MSSVSKSINCNGKKSFPFENQSSRLFDGFEFKTIKMVDADVASSKEYTEFESKHNRHLNMMAESVRIPLTDKTC